MTDWNTLQEPLRTLAEVQLDTAKLVFLHGQSWLSEIYLIDNLGISIIMIGETDDPMGAGIFEIQRRKPEAYIFASEGWIAAVPIVAGILPKRGDATRSPNRIEVWNQVVSDRKSIRSRLFTIDRLNGMLNKYEIPWKPDLEVWRLPATW